MVVSNVETHIQQLIATATEKMIVSIVFTVTKCSLYSQMKAKTTEIAMQIQQMEVMPELVYTGLQALKSS